MKKKFKKEYLLLIISMIIFIIILEIILRTLSFPVYGFSEGMFIKDKNAGYKLAPDYSGKQSIFGKVTNIKTNLKGLRDFREYSYEKNIKRILILGDSFSFGNGAEIEESYPENLRKNFRGEYEIVNLGVPGYDLHNEYVSFIREGKKYNPDIILMQFALNDWGNHYIIEENGEVKVKEGSTFCVDKKGYLVSCNEDILRKVHLSLLRDVRVYSFFYSKLRNVFSLMLNKLGKENPPLYFYNKDSKEYKQAYEGYFNIVKKLKENTNATLILFVGPSKEDFVNAEEIKKTYNLNYLTDTSQVKSDVEKIGEELEIKVIKIDFDSPDLFLKIDGHWTPEGNRIIAEELYEKLR